MRINGENHYRLAAVHPRNPYLLHLVATYQGAECGEPISPAGHWIALVVRDDNEFLCDDCVLGRQLRRLSGHREVNYAKVGEKMLADLQAAYVQHVAEDGVR